ncbi:MAG: MarR family transcriptional regulator [Chloroflexi bacterium]|nr:MarR family transcriptional regulator [Chloroflexota bacterium]
MLLPGDFPPEELDVRQRIAELPTNLLAYGVVSNIWRVAQELKLSMERTVLREFDLTWAGFATLFIVWVWGPIETREIAKSQGVTRPTVTSTVSLLEKNGLCVRQPSTADRRLVLVELTPKGKGLIEQVFPLFNHGEARIISDLSEEEQETLAALLRKVVKSMRSREAGGNGKIL